MKAKPMPVPTQVTFRGMSPSDAVVARIEERAAALEHFYKRVTSCHVVVEAPHRHHHKGKLYVIKIDLRVPGQEIAIGNSGPHDHAHEDVFVAVRDAFDALTRRIEDTARRMRGDVKQLRGGRRTRSGPAGL